MNQKSLQVRMLSSMAKVFPNRIYGNTASQCRTLRGQEVAFQIAYRLNMPPRSLCEFRISVDSPIKQFLKIYRVGVVPSLFPCYPASSDDGNYLTRKAGLFPDPLIPFEGDRIKAVAKTWQALWFSIQIDGSMPAGKYPIKLSVFDESENQIVNKTYFVCVDDQTLPQSDLLFTQWFHCDCIADAHHVEIFSEAHWRLIENYMRLAGAHGMNMILTPVVTPPLDTAVGGERPTVQLVQVEKTAQGYRFDCERLRRYIKIALDAGMVAFEISHFFTQWGAGFAPKVVARTDGKLQKIFGWETAADDPEYVKFLQALVPEVIACFAGEGVGRERLWFHLSDEPHEDQIDQYRKTHDILAPLIGGCHHMDAMSSLLFRKEGLVESPVVSTNHISPFLKEKVEGLWCYYCCMQGYKLSNRFFAMPSARTRIMGVQLYKYQIVGFLQWGYNFYYTQFSKAKIDPYAVTDAGSAFPSGDAFSVYPYEDGAAPSIRQKAFSNGLEDYRLLLLLERKIGRDAVLALLERVAGMEITFYEYPQDERFFSELYDAVLNELTN